MKITFLGHAACWIQTDGYHLLIDPFLSGNPLAAMGPEEVSAHYILVSHGHGDHLGDAIPIAQRTGATIIAPYELATYCARFGVQAHPMHIGGAYDFPFGRVKLTPALHGSGYVTEQEEILYLGHPCGFLIWAEGRCLYHAGDTGLFGDMRLIGEHHRPDVALLPIGDNFTMGPEDALRAVEMLRPQVVIPIHYNTFPVIQQNPAEFAEKVKGLARCVLLQPGESYEL